MNKEEIKDRLKNVEALISESKETVQSYKTERKQLKKQLEELPKLEAGQWYWADKGCVNQALVYVESCNDVYSFTGYGFNISGWNDSNKRWVTTMFDTPATPQEVETALIAEAKKIGIDLGNHKCLDDGDVWPTDNAHFGWSFTEDLNILMLGSSVVFRNGKWSEIIKTPTVHIPEGDYTKTQLNDIINNKF